MVSNKMGHPLSFWSAVEELKETQTARGRQLLVLQIFKRFFSRGAKQGYLLDCSDDIIRQIPTMEKVPASVMVCAQASVFRSMERKWYPRYLETYPTDAEYRESMNESYPPRANIYQMKDFDPKIGKPRRMRRKKTMNLWHGFSNAILDFLRAIKDPKERRLFEIYLKYETDRDQEAPTSALEKSLMTSSSMEVQTRVVMRNRLVIINKLGNDLLFWIEVEKYRKQVETLKTLENISKSDSDLLVVKARAIIESFLVSDILPRVQINIPNELGHSIGNSLNSAGPVRGLFHDAIILLFPILYYFWKRFHESWLTNTTPEDVLAKIESQIKPKRSLTPHSDKDLPPFFNIRYSKVDVTTQTVYIPDDDRFKISFSMVHGMRLIYPIPRGQKTGLEKHSTSQMSKRVVKPSHMSVSNLKKSAGESRTKLQKQSLAENTTTSPKAQRMNFKIPVKVLTPQQERAKKLSLLVEELNKQSSGKAKKITKPLRSFDAVVNAALSLRKGNVFAGIDE
ncbi:regulator of G-protein signaling protein-like [Ylistrum balloti]|uniref:regulator of G-protein signaling protein-like n=1 Tax=Ylistrum balloti TaxID=509963 RepID=UPI002905D4FC|nr:regulator of G-protein signaling protein-like [Ylistrum balloti]